MIPVGRLQVATPATMAAAVRGATDAREAVKEVIAPVIAEDETLGPILGAAASVKISEAFESADIIVGSDPRLPRNVTRLVRDELVMQEKYASPDKSADGAILGGWHADGSYEFEVAPRWPGSGSAGGSLEGQTFSSRWAKIGVGDSLVEGYSNGAYWPASDSFIAKAALSDPRATYVNLGMSGATVDEVCIQVGALPLTAQAQVVVPASGTVGVTVQAGIGWRPDRTWSFHGKLGTVAGTITRTSTATTALTFVPDAGQGGVTLPAGTQFVSDNVVHRDAIPIIMMGRNNVSYDVKGTHATVADHVIAGYTRLVAWLDAQNKRFLVCGTINQTNELSGSANYVIIKAVNDYLAATYPLNWVNVRAYLVTQAIKDQGITPTAADDTAMTGDAPPPSVMDDPTHYSKASAVGIGALTSTAIMRRDWRA